MYPYTSFEDIDLHSPKAIDQVQHFYQTHIDSLSFLLDQASELIESEIRPNDETNIAIAHKMIEMAAKRMESLMT